MVADATTGTFRVRCRGKYCRREGLVTYHVFDLATGRLIRTDDLPYRDPRELLGSREES